MKILAVHTQIQRWSDTVPKPRTKYIYVIYKDIISVVYIDIERHFKQYAWLSKHRILETKYFYSHLSRSNTIYSSITKINI